jgi:hypothetical protein
MSREVDCIFRKVASMLRDSAFTFENLASMSRKARCTSRPADSTSLAHVSTSPPGLLRSGRGHHNLGRGDANSSTVAFTSCRHVVTCARADFTSREARALPTVPRCLASASSTFPRRRLREVQARRESWRARASPFARGRSRCRDGRQARKGRMDFLPAALEMLYRCLCMSSSLESPQAGRHA